MPMRSSSVRLTIVSMRRRFRLRTRSLRPLLRGGGSGRTEDRGQLVAHDDGDGEKCEWSWVKRCLAGHTELRASRRACLNHRQRAQTLRTRDVPVDRAFSRLVVAVSSQKSTARNHSPPAAPVSDGRPSHGLTSKRPKRW
ncbi:hypothetical protein C8Q76DRAFT_249419 [Earliella scabrosa]|nr:hypothetical protein C8Q76DRAFT_249419 [Earliella scabrosa]